MNCVKNWEFRNKYAKRMGLAPKDVLAMAMDWNRCMRKRKEFIMSHPKKIEICKKILEARKDKKCITFSATIKDSEAIGVGEVIHSKKSKAKNKENSIYSETSSITIELFLHKYLSDNKIHSLDSNNYIFNT